MLKAANQALCAVLLAVCIGFVVSLTPTPYQKYPIDGCEESQTTYDKNKSEPGIFALVAWRVICGVHNNREDINAWSVLVIAAFANSDAIRPAIPI